MVPYELNYHSTKPTVQSLHYRWKRKDESTILNIQPDADFLICALHAKRAAVSHPTNYYPFNSTTHFNVHHSPLGPSSRVLIALT
jgi:hypothetical protein